MLSNIDCDDGWLCCSSRDSGISSSKSSRRTPAATPAYRYNDWMDNKKSIKYTPKLAAKDRENAKGFVFIYSFVHNICIDERVFCHSEFCSVYNIISCSTSN